MRRFLLLVPSALLMLAAAMPAAAATAHYRYTVHGSGAWASAFAQTEQRFEAGWVEIGDQATVATDGETFTSYVMFEHLLEVCDGNGCVQTFTSGWAEKVPFSIDRKKLASASVRVEVPSVRCVDDGQTQACDEVTIPVEVSWAGYGAMIRSHGTASGGIAGEYQYTLNGAATERWAEVRGSIGTFDLESASPIGALYKTRQAERDIFHA